MHFIVVLFPSIHTDVMYGRLYYKHFAFVCLTSTDLPVMQFNLKHYCHVNRMSKVTVCKPFKPSTTDTEENLFAVDLM